MKLGLGNRFIRSYGDSLLVSLGFQENDNAYLFSSYFIEEIQFEYNNFRGQGASIFIRCGGRVTISPISDLNPDLRTVRDLSVDELMKVVYDKLQQRSES
jgi:hypothetical protein